MKENEDGGAVSLGGEIVSNQRTQAALFKAEINGQATADETKYSAQHQTMNHPILMVVSLKLSALYKYDTREKSLFYADRNMKRKSKWSGVTQQKILTVVLITKSWEDQSNQGDDFD